MTKNNVESQAWAPRSGVIVVLGLLFWQFVFLYSNRLRYFFIYFVLSISIVLIVWPLEEILIVLYILCPIHALYLSKGYDTSLKRPWYSEWWGVTACLVITMGLLIIVRSFIVEPFRIPSDSMKPYLKVGDIILVNKMGYGSYGTYGVKLDFENDQELGRGSVYAFRHPKKEIKYVKRLIGKSGDTIRVSDNTIYLNGIALNSTLLGEDDDFQYLEETLERETYTIMISKGESRKFDRSYLIPSGSYFFLGDNRDKSYDSRYWGFVSHDNIVGKVSYVFKQD